MKIDLASISSLLSNQNVNYSSPSFISFKTIILAAGLCLSISACRNGSSSSTNNSRDTTSNDSLAGQVRQETRRSWDACQKYARGHDELSPLTRSYHDWYKTSIHISPMDAYSTLKIMGLDSESRAIEKYVMDSVRFDQDVYVKTFEVNIRILGGLLTMYELAGDKRLLDKAEDFGKRLLPAFHTPSGIPAYYVNLKTGKTRGDTVNVAEAGSYTFEMGILSFYTKNPRYYQIAKKASKAVYARCSKLGLVPKNINIQTGKWLDSLSFIGDYADSYYEYLYKSALLFHDQELLDMWKESIKPVQKYMAEESDTSLWYGKANIYTGKIQRHDVSLYDAYFPALLALSGDMKHAEKAQKTWNWLWNKNHLEPMFYEYKKDSIIEPTYNLNPEIMESAYYLFHFTKDARYQDMARTYYADILKYCRTPVAFTHVADVRTKKQANAMSSFFIAETMKYLYLTFGGRKDINPDTYVFSTEAHPFKKSDFPASEMGKRLGINKLVN